MKEDELMMQVRSFWPRLWWNLYQGCLEVGFNQAQALNLVQTYILKDGRVSPNEGQGPKSDNPDEL